MTLIEICVEDTAGVRIARDAGADRVELCSRLDIGGLTPSKEIIMASLPVAPPSGIQIMVRSRGGDFVYSKDEIKEIIDEIGKIRSFTQGSAVSCGFVVGALREDGHIDHEAVQSFREAAGECPLTFHRAFDCIPSLTEGLETLIDAGYQHVLTTGGHPSNADVNALRALVEQADNRLHIIASGGLRAHNVVDVMRQTGTPQVHMRAPHPLGGTDATETRRIVSCIRAFNARI
ncbi:copper homeostasis protein CutC [Schaalia sp. lx-260]|uniref:copper homeostasis protein CutC n=1 Tax=Schaalia sp. lx-260 TaxID=2899082 RepID=UPI001E4C5514|nr:copper homeostasis protein CutC [Schaalia sp. lx-260]MCD4550157.1 copper homeostasis protein CutC [Schaalia sp. lx-260]